MILFTRINLPWWQVATRLTRAEEEANSAWETVLELAHEHRTTRDLLYVSLALNALAIGIGLLAVFFR